MRKTGGRTSSPSSLYFSLRYPLCLGISMASGFPPQAGIFTAIVGGLVVSRINGSYVTIAGSAAGLIVVILDSVQTLGEGDAKAGRYYRELRRQSHLSATGLSIPVRYMVVRFYLQSATPRSKNVVPSEICPDTLIPKVKVMHYECEPMRMVLLESRWWLFAHDRTDKIDERLNEEKLSANALDSEKRLANVASGRPVRVVSARY